jgi:hypothetical protein
MPARLAIDGDLGEWGFDRDAASVRVALGNDGAALAAVLDADATGGLWVGIGSDARPLRPNGHTCAGPASTEEAEAACEAQQQDYEAFASKRRRAFVRLYRVERAGVRVVSDDGALVPVSGARLAWTALGTGAAAELFIPAESLPRFEAAPLTHIQITTSAAPTPPPLDPERWSGLALPGERLFPAP